MADDGEAKQKREYRLSAPVQKAIVLLTDGTTRTVTETASAVGMTREGLSKALQRPAVQEALRKRITSVLGAGAAAASARLIELLRNDNGMVQFQSSKLLLGLSGYQPPPRPVTQFTVFTGDIRPGWVIDLAEQPGEHAAAETIGPAGAVLLGPPRGGQVLDLKAREAEAPVIGTTERDD